MSDADLRPLIEGLGAPPVRRPLIRPAVARLASDQLGLRHATWLELFYDLVFVVTVAELANNLSRDVSWTGVLEYIFLFIPVIWVWAGTTFYADRFDPDDAVHRGLTALQMIAVCALAVSVHDGLGDTSRAFALSYVAARTTLLLMYVRAYRSARDAEYRPMISRYLRGFGLAALIWFASAFVPTPARFFMWGIALVVDIWTPLGMRRLQLLTPLDRSHLSERFGLFVIIVLVESVIGVVGGLAEQNLNTSSVIGALFAMVVAVSIWWVYFDEPDDTAVQRLGLAGQVWIYSHMPLLMAIAASGVAIEHVLANDEVLPADRWLLCGAFAATMTATAVIHLTSLTDRRDVLRHTSAWWRLGAAALLLLLGVLGASLESAILLAVAASICFSQVVLDVAFDVHEDRELVTS